MNRYIAFLVKNSQAVNNPFANPYGYKLDRNGFIYFAARLDKSWVGA